MNIGIDYNGKHYCLEYSREAVMEMENEGFSITDVQEKMMLRSKQLWTGAFKKNHPDTSEAVIMEMYDKYIGKKAVKDALQTMIIDTYKFLVPEDEEDLGNLGVTVNP